MDKHGRRTPDVSHPVSERWVTMDTASDPVLMPDLLIPLKLQLCVSGRVFPVVAFLSYCIHLNEINNFASLVRPRRLFLCISFSLAPRLSAHLPSYVRIYLVLLMVGCYVRCHK